MNWRDVLRDLFAPPVPKESASPRTSRFDLGICSGCRGLRLRDSPRCEHCGSTAGVTADA